MLINRFTLIRRAAVKRNKQRHLKRRVLFQNKRRYHVVQAMDALKAWKSSEMNQFIDLRSPPDVENMFIDKFQNIPFGKLKEKVNDIPKNSNIFLLCKTSFKSVQAAKLLESSGHGNVHVIDGGILNWFYANPSSVQVNDPTLKETRQNLLNISSIDVRPTLSDISDLYAKLLIEDTSDKDPRHRDEEEAEMNLFEKITKDPPGLKHEGL